MAFVLMTFVQTTFVLKTLIDELKFYVFDPINLSKKTLYFHKCHLQQMLIEQWSFRRMSIGQFPYRSNVEVTNIDGTKVDATLGR